MSSMMIKKTLSGASMRPQQLLAQPENVNAMVLGVVYGAVTDDKKMTSATGEVMQGLAGKFVYRSTNPEIAPDCAAYVFWPASGFLTDVFAHLRAPAYDGAPIEFAYEISVLRAANPAGYTWGYRPLIETAEGDPLEKLEAKIADQLPNPRQVVMALENSPVESKPAKEKAGV